MTNSKKLQQDLAKVQDALKAEKVMLFDRCIVILHRYKKQLYVTIKAVPSSDNDGIASMLHSILTMMVNIAEVYNDPCLDNKVSEDCYESAKPYSDDGVKFVMVMRVLDPSTLLSQSKLKKYTRLHNKDHLNDISNNIGYTMATYEGTSAYIRELIEKSALYQVMKHELGVVPKELLRMAGY